MSKAGLIFTNRNFRLYFFADVISGIGSGISFIGFNWFILDTTKSSANIGFFMALSLISGLLLFPFAGTIADRFNKRNILIFLNIILGILLSVLSLLIYLDMLLFDIIYLVSVINGVGFTIFIPASRGLIQELLFKDQYIKGNSLIEISLQISIFLAAGMTGIIYKYFGFELILLIDGLSFLFGTLILSKIANAGARRKENMESFRLQFLNGLKYLAGNRSILLFGIFILIPFCVTITSNVVLPSYVNNYLARDSVVFGFAEMSFGLGAFLAGILISRAFKKDMLIIIITSLFIFSAGSLLSLSFNKGITGLFAAYLIFGFSNTSLKIILNTELMTIIPKEQFGRAMAFFMAVSSLFQIAGTFGMGNLMDIIPAPYGFLILALLMLTGFVFNIAVIPLLNFRKIDETKEPEKLRI